MSPGTPRVTRHRWDSRDKCINCGTTREGYSGGRTGMLLYRPVNGNPSYQAGDCKPPGRPPGDPRRSPRDRYTKGKR